MLSARRSRCTPCPAVPTALLTALLAGLLLALVNPPQAAAAGAYRYWGYFHLTGGAWTFATKGVEAEVPADGAVEGYRFAVADMQLTRPPRAVLSFEQICGSTPAQSGRKRVGVVIDYGRPADARTAVNPPAPVALCAVADPAANAAKVLGAVAAVRIESAMLCGINDYPGSGPCTEPVATVPSAAAAPETPASILPPPSAGSTAVAGPSTVAARPDASTSAASPWGWVAVLLIVSAIAAAALLSLRRRRGAMSADRAR